MADNVAKAVGAAGLPLSSVPEFVADLLGQNTTGLAEVPGVTPDIVNAGVGALLDTYTKGFRNVWASAAAFVTLATIGMFYVKPVMICTNELTISSVHLPFRSQQRIYQPHRCPCREG